MKKSVCALLAGCATATHLAVPEMGMETERSGHSVELWGVNAKAGSSDWNVYAKLNIDIFMGWTAGMTVGVSTSNQPTVLKWTPTIIADIGGVQKLGFKTPFIGLGVKANTDIAKIYVPLTLQIDLADFSGFAVNVWAKYDIVSLKT